MPKVAKSSIFGRVAAGLVMGSVALALIGLAATAGWPRTGSYYPVVPLILPAVAVATVLIVALSTTAWAAWGRLCLANGVVSIVLAATSLQGRGQPLWAADRLYERALDQGMRWWLGRLMCSAAEYSGTAILAAVAFFVLAYRLLHWPHRRDRAAH